MMGLTKNVVSRGTYTVADPTEALQAASHASKKAYTCIYYIYKYIISKKNNKIKKRITCESSVYPSLVAP